MRTVIWIKKKRISSAWATIEYYDFIKSKQQQWRKVFNLFELSFKFLKIYSKLCHIVKYM